MEAECRRFESYHPDQRYKMRYKVIIEFGIEADDIQAASDIGDDIAQSLPIRETAVRTGCCSKVEEFKEYN